MSLVHLLCFVALAASAVFAIEQQLHSQFFCIDIHGKVELCTNNSRPLHWMPNDVAYARYFNRINQTGWAELEVVTNGAQPDAIQAYYAGFIEGYLTAPLIDSSRRSNGLGHSPAENNRSCGNLTEYIQANLNYTVEQVENLGSNNSYWNQVGLTLNQIAGLDDGIAAAQNKFTKFRTPHFDINPCGTLQLNLVAEQEDLQNIQRKRTNPNRQSHCSAIIKYFPEKSEVLVAHNTWDGYESMLRLLKKYTLNYSTSKAKSVSMSSFPGIVFSMDDFYITSQHMVIQETSIDNFNDAAWEALGPRNVVFEFVRNVVANRLAANGSEWAKIFSKHNSGTYNNQFMIVDFKKLIKSASNSSLAPGFLTVLEQMPHYIHYEDMTDHFADHSYWASYNIPFYEDIYEYSGYRKMFDKYGLHYSYTEYPRARMFARDQAKVQNISTLFHLMRYNDFKNDPFSVCNCTPRHNGEYGLAARADLNDPKGKYPLYDLTFRASGAIDAKMTSIGLAKDLEFVAVSGPTDEGQPAFNWDTFPDKTVLHYDQPKLWKFKPVITKWNSASASGFPEFKFDL